MALGPDEAQQRADLPDDELPMMADPSLAFWKSNAQMMLSESTKGIEETAKQIIGLAGLLEGIYFHAIAYSNLRGKVSVVTLLFYVAPLICWLFSLSFALMVFFPRSYATNINSASESRAAFERMVRYKHENLKAAGVWLALGSLALATALGAYLAG